MRTARALPALLAIPALRQRDVSRSRVAQRRVYLCSAARTATQCLAYAHAFCAIGSRLLPSDIPGRSVSQPCFDRLIAGSHCDSATHIV